MAWGRQIEAGIANFGYLMVVEDSISLDGARGWLNANAWVVPDQITTGRPIEKHF